MSTRRCARSRATCSTATDAGPGPGGEERGRQPLSLRFETPPPQSGFALGEDLGSALVAPLVVADAVGGVVLGDLVAGHRAGAGADDRAAGLAAAVGERVAQEAAG